MPYEMYEREMRMRAKLSLDTRRALAAGQELGYNLNKVLSNNTLKVNSDSIIQANKDVIMLQQNLQAALNPTRGTIDLAMFDTQLQKSGKNLTAYAQSLSKYGKDGADAYISLTKAISAAEAPTTRLSQGLKDAGEQLKRTIGWQLSSSAIHGVMSTYSQAIGYAKELNRSLTDIRIVTGQSQAQMANFAKYANVAAKNLSSTTTRYTDAALIYYQQGLSEKAVKDRADITIKMANVAGVSAEKASQQLTAIWNNFDNGSKSLEHYADVLVKLGAETASSTDEISKGVQKFAAIGNTVGLSYEYAASALATVTATTRESADTVGTSFRTLFSRLQGLSLGETMEDGTTLNKYSKALNTIGVRIKETNGDMKSMNDILDEIGSKWSGLNKDTQIGLAQSIGGARQYSTFMALMDNWDYFQENVNRANNAAGALQEQQDIYAESWDAASKRVQTSMEKIFDTVINDKITIGITDVFAGALNGVNGLIEGFGGLGGIMSSVSGIFMTKYAKEMPRVWEEMRYNWDYMFNGKQGTITNKQNKIFSDAEKGISEIALANNIGILEDGTFDTSGRNAALAQQLNNAKTSMERRKQYLAVERTLSEQEKEAYQNQLAILDMWDGDVVAKAQMVQDQENILSEERKRVATDLYESAKKDFKDKRDANKDNIAAWEKEREEFQKTSYNGYDLSTAEGRERFYNSFSEKDRKRYNEIIEGAGKNTPTFEDSRKGRKFKALFEAGEKAKQFETSPFEVISKEQQDFLNENIEKIGANTVEAYKTAADKMSRGEALLHTERIAVEQVFTSFQEPVVNAAVGMGAVNESLKKFDTSLTNLSDSTAQTGSKIKTTLGKDLKTSVDSVEREYRKQLESIGTFSKDEKGNEVFTLNKKYAEAEGGENLQKDITKTLERFKEMGTKFDADGTFIGTTEDFKGFSEDVKKQSSAILNAAEKQSLANVDSDVITEALEKGAKEFSLREASGQRKREFDAVEIEHQIEKSEKIMQTASTLAAATAAVQASVSTYQTLTSKDATLLEKGMAVTGNVASGLMLMGSMKQTGATLAAGAASGSLMNTIGGALAGPIGMAITAALSVLPGLVTYIGEQIETSSEKEERQEKEYLDLRQQVQVSQQQQDALKQTNESYFNSIEKFNATQYGTLENTKALSQANQHALDLIQNNNLTTDDYSFNDNGLIEIDSSALEKAEEQLVQKTLNLQAESSIADVTKLLRARTENDEQYYRPVLTEYGSMAPIDKQAVFGQLEYAKQMEQEGFEWGSEYYKDILTAYNAREKENTQIISAFNQALLTTANSDGYFNESDKTAIATLTQSISAETLKQMQVDLDARYDSVINETEESLRERATSQNEAGASVMSEESFQKILDSQEYKDLKAQDEQQAINFLGAQIKNQAYLNEYTKLIDKAKEEEKALDSRYQKSSLNDYNMGELKASLDRIDENNNEIKNKSLYQLATDQNLSKEYDFALAQYNKVATDFYKAIGEYLPDTTFTGALENFTLYEAEVLSETLQDFGETFGNDAAKSIYNATLNASEKDREVLLTNLKSVDFSGSALQSLDQIYELSEDFGGQYTELFEDIRQSFGGDAGIFKTLTNDKAIQKLMSNFENFGDIDAESIMKASHSSSDLALALELANFNAGGLAAALEGVASGTINEKQVSNSLLAGLSTLNQIDAVRGAAFDSVDSYDKGRAVTDLTKFAGNLGRTINYNLRNGLMFDEPMMNAWGEMFGENKRYELKQDFLSWGSVDKNDIATKFNSKYKAEKELLEAMQKNPYDFNALWKYAFDTSQVEENEKENDEWIKSGEDKEDVENRSYNSISEHEWDTYLKLTKLDENGNRVARNDLNNYDKDFVDQVKVKVDKENRYKDNYVNIDGAIYKIGEGERDVQWNGKKWVHKDAKGNEVALNNNNALFGYDYAKNGMVFTDYFEQQNMSYEDLQNIMQLNLGLSKNTTDRMIAEAAAQNTSVQKLYGDGQVNAAVNAMVGTANEKNEFITADQMELIFNNSEDLQAKYQGVGFTGWIRDYLSGADLSKEDVLAGKLGERQAFKERYVDFRGAKSNSYEDMDEALFANTGVSTADRLKGLGKQMTINKKTTETQTLASGKWGSIEKEVTKETPTEVTGFDMSDAMDQLLAMGYTQEAAYEALNDTVKQNGGVLVESIRGVDGSIQVFSSESQAYQDWAVSHGVKTEEENAEAFGRFISEQDAVAKAVQQMAIEAQAKAEYERTHNADGTLKTPEQIAEEGGAAEGDVATDENGNPIVDQNKDGKPDTTATGPDVKPQEVVAGDPGSTTPGTGGGEDKSQYGGLTKEQYDIVMDSNQVRYENGKFVMVNGFNPATDPYGGDEGTWRQQNQATIDAVNAANKAAEAAAEVAQKQAALQGKAVGQNQHKITKHYASGRNNDDYEGLAQVGELGPELSIDKDGNATMLGVNGPTYAYVEKDDIIFTAEQTEDILRTTPDLNNVPGFSGSKGMSGATTGVSSMYIHDNIWDGYGDSSGGSGGSGEDDDWEPDRYVVIMEQLQDLQREYARLVKAKERAYGADKIKALDAEIAKTNDLISAQKQYINEIEQFLQKDIQKLKDEGVYDSLVFDKNGVIRNFDEISEKYKKAAEEGDEAAAKQYEAIMKYMETNNLLEQQMDSLIDMQWQLMDARIERITTKVDIKVAVDDTDLQYLSYQLGKINEEAYDVAKALNLVGESMEINLNKVNAYRQGLGETLQEAFTEIGLDENAQKELLDKIEQGTLTQEDLDNFEISPDHSANIMNVLLDYRQQLITVNQQLDQLRDQVTDLVVRHFTDFTKDVGKQTSLINTYTNTLQTYANLTELLNGRFQGNMDKVLADINSTISKNAKDSIKNTELTVQAAELKYKELNEMYLAAQEIGDQATMDKVADARDTAYKELQEANSKYASAWLSANEAFLNEFKFGVNKAIENFQEQLSPLFGTVEALSASFERQNGLNDQYVDDYEKYYELNKLNRDLQTAIDETDNVNSKKALAKLQEEINKEKASENKLSEYDLEVLRNKVELEKARLALDEAKNAKSTVTLSRDQNGNWGYVYTAEEDKVAKAEQDYEDKLYEYQRANKEYIDDLQTMVIEAQTNMVEAINALDVNDPHYEEQRKSIIDSYMQTIAYVKEQMTSALGNQEDSRLVALERYDISMINLKNDFEDLSLSFVTGEKNLENYFATLETSMPQLLAQLNELEKKYEANIADINNYVTGNKNIADYMNENMDTLVNKSEEANLKIQGLYDTMVDELADVNKEVADIYNNWLPHIMEMTTKNELLAESISKIQHELSDLSEVEVPPVLQGTNWEHPEGYTENDYGVIRKLTEDEIKLREEIAKEIKKDDKGVITNYDELKEKWYEEAPAEGEEDKRDADKKAKWELLQKLIGYGAYGDPTAKQTIGLTGVWETIQSNAAAMYKAAETIAQGFKGSTLMVEQTVHINADFSGVTDRNEIQEAFNNLINEAAQYAYRRN